ncbi:hypothetical protein Rhopal_002123-T1 [Rhodotorula paludigena]|uniref:Glycosyl transferase 64 domain-containing protein n=1 Tax=Rhodotorula paludigena TaxID=86838 RepID=A0AAV5GIX3_9BASI|nr:hypothetical protein Rhopal_002123-T1 [Rhodotorula paludigena]
MLRPPPRRLLSVLLAALSLLTVSLPSVSASRVEVSPGATDAEGRATINLSVDPSDGFSLVIASYKRDENLPPLLGHLTTSPPASLRHILIVWQNVDRDVPDFLNATALEQYSTSGVAVSVRKSERNSMNERFRPSLDWNEEIYTRAVMIMDDDVVLRRDVLEWGYQEFVNANERGGPGRLVGFMARDFDEKDGEVKYVVRPTKTYSMVLSNSVWLKKEWLEKYWEDTTEMRTLRDYVDEVFNCDDILINYVVSNLTGSAPLLLQPKVPLRTIGGDGLFHRGSVAVDDDGNDVPEDDAAIDAAAGMPKPGHFNQRQQCLERYFAHFAQFAPPSTTPGAAPSNHFPLVKTSTSVSQDVEDHSRWLSRGEPWEEVKAQWEAAVSTAPAAVPEPEPEPEQEDEWEDLFESMSDEERAEQAEFEAMLDGLTDEEIEDLLFEMDMEGSEGSLNGEEGLPKERSSEAGLFEEPSQQEVLQDASKTTHDEL